MTSRSSYSSSASDGTVSVSALGSSTSSGTTSVDALRTLSTSGGGTTNRPAGTSSRNLPSGYMYVGYVCVSCRYSVHCTFKCSSNVKQ